jgi:hypothetical protein
MPSPEATVAGRGTLPGPDRLRTASLRLRIVRLRRTGYEIVDASIAGSVLGSTGGEHLVAL